MVHYYRYQQWKKGLKKHIGKDEESQVLSMEFSNSGFYKRTKPKFLYFLFLSLLSSSFLFSAHLFSSSSLFSLLYSFSVIKDDHADNVDASAPLCSSVSNGTLCCDRSSIRSDICIMKGDVRTSSPSSSIFLYTSKNSNGLTNYISSKVNEGRELQHEKIMPYTRKWEKSIMDTINELNLITKLENPGSIHEHQCDVVHDVPAVFFSTGGYTGNVYHEFNDGILPLYITSQHFNKKVVFVILDYHNWWLMKYGDILSHLTDYPPINFSEDNRTHCFSEAIVGLRIHDELTVDSSLMKGNKHIVDFRNLLDQAYQPRITSLVQEEEKQNLAIISPSSEIPLQVLDQNQLKKPKLVILSRTGSREITNENSLVKMGEEIGFQVEVLKPDRTTELAKIYWVINSSDVMIGAHGAAMTHFLFMRPGSVFIQVIPLGTSWAAETYYGEPARRLGLKYIGYEISDEESSLYEKYDKNDPVLRDPKRVTKKGWEFTKKIYLDGQNVRLNLDRFQKRLDRAYYYSIARTRRHFDV